MNINQIKLVIWDLDETFWQGTLSEDTMQFLPENAELVSLMADSGVISSICSKNDEASVKQALTDREVWDLFVFPSINWTPKGSRVLQIVQHMNLRPVNVLFIDDNPSNRAEVQAACPDISVADVDVIPTLAKYFRDAEKKDASRTRLAQYRLLEQKAKFEALCGSNEAFLESCSINVQIGYDCISHIDRIHDLILRSNQLNFTKVRSTKEELTALLQDETVKTGYVEVRDKFGDYGIVGFFALKDCRLIHFAFSCRTLNMGIEQYIYKQLGFPNIEIQGEVSSNLTNPDPYWINRCTDVPLQEKTTLANKGRILLKGLCDMQQIFSFIRDNDRILTEFVYVNDNGVSIESGCHTMHILEGATLDREVTARLIRTLPFGDEGMFDTAIFEPNISFVFLSMLTDPNLGMYREKESGAIVAFGEYTNDLTDKKLWPKFIRKELFVANCEFTEKNLRYIKEHFEFIGRISPGNTVCNLETILEKLHPGTNLVLLLGSETPYEANVQPAYADRHLYHRELNDHIRKWSAQKTNVFLLDVNQYIEGQSSFTNNINHFTKSVYYHISKNLIELINQNGMSVLRESTSLERKLSSIHSLLCRVPKKFRRTVKRIKHRFFAR